MHVAQTDEFRLRRLQARFADGAAGAARFQDAADWRKIPVMKRLLLIFCLSVLAGPAPAIAGGMGMLAPPSINIQPRLPVLDQQCVDKLKGEGASTARAAHECRKAASPGTPQPLALREQNQPAITPPPAPTP